jgi:hypothetical protein
MPIPTGFDLETLSPVEVKRLLVLYFLPKALTLTFALPLKRGKQDYVIIHPETYRPRILRSQLLFLSPGSLTRNFSVAVLAKLDEGNRVHLYDDNGQNESLVQVRLYAFLGHNQF